MSTGWFHGDCIAEPHNTEIGSDLYYSIVDKYMQTYVKFGHNMILTPVFTPPLDTAIGKERPTNQLVDITVNNGQYTFGFENLGKWIDLCIKNNIEYYEISHLFTQWGAKNAPKIMATVGVIKRPVVAIDHIKPFIEAGAEDLWAYYCMGQRMNVANRFIAQPSYRNRILGYQLYKNDIKGFLQWGFNFWFTACSQSVINPYINSTAGTAFPGGDPFVVYPLDEND